MSSWATIDASVFLASVLTEQYTKEARALLESLKQQNITIAAPVLVHYEIAAVLRKHTYRGTLTLEEATSALQLLLAQPVQTFVDNTLLQRGYELAGEFNRPTAYDSQYLAVAERLASDFWTADERLYNALHSRLSWIQWLGNYTLPSTNIP